MTGYSVGLSACKKEGREKLRWLTVILGAKALQAITRAAASPVRRFENWRCSRTSPLYDNETSKKWDTINATHADNVSAHPPSAANIVSLSSMPMGYSNALDSPLHRRLSSFSLHGRLLSAPHTKAVYEQRRRRLAYPGSILQSTLIPFIAGGHNRGTGEYARHTSLRFRAMA